MQAVAALTDKLQVLNKLSTNIEHIKKFHKIVVESCFHVQISVEKFQPATENGAASDEDDYEERVVERPQEVEVEEVREREVIQEVVETRQIPQVRASYAYKGQGMTIDKGEVGAATCVSLF